MSDLVNRAVEERLRPKVRVDGGDITFARMEGQTVVIEAHADCATCPTTAECLAVWLKNELRKAVDPGLNVRIERRVAYYAR